MKINILISFDDLDGNYTRHCAVTMLSILETNKNNKIKFYILSSCLSEDNIKELKRIARQYNQEIEFIVKDNIIPEDIKLLFINHTKLTQGTFYRLFFNLYIDDIDRILYLDCDTIVTKDLTKIFNMDMKGKTIAGYYDSEICKTNKQVLDTNHYINAGVLLIDIKRYNEHEITSREIKEINNKYGKYIDLADQDYLNIIFRDEILIYEKGINYLLTKPFFNKEMNKATILHCLAKPYFKYSFCPKKVVKLYYKYLNKTKWKKFTKKENSTSIGKYCYDLLSILFYLFVQKIFGINRVIRFTNLRITENLYKLLGKKINNL